MFENTFIVALGLMFIFEGLMPFIIPKAWKKMMQEACSVPESKIRIMGLVAMIFGTLIIVTFD